MKIHFTKPTIQLLCDLDNCNYTQVRGNKSIHKSLGWAIFWLINQVIEFDWTNIKYNHQLASLKRKKKKKTKQ